MKEDKEKCVYLNKSYGCWALKSKCDPFNPECDFRTENPTDEKVVESVKMVDKIKTILQKVFNVRDWDDYALENVERATLAILTAITKAGYVHAQSQGYIPKARAEEFVEIDADELGLVLYDISREGGFEGITCKVMADRIAQAKDILKLKEPNDEKEKVS